MKVANRLSTFFADIGDDAVAVRDSFLFRDLGANTEQMAEQFSVLVAGRSSTDQGFAWYHQHMNRGMWVDVPEGNAVVVFPHQIGGDFTIQNLLKNGHFYVYSALSASASSTMDFHSASLSSSDSSISITGKPSTIW